MVLCTFIFVTLDVVAKNQSRRIYVFLHNKTVQKVELINNYDEMKFSMSIIQNMKILIIDDNPHLVRIFTKMLQIEGFSAVGATTLKTGLQHIENKSYDAVFVDVPLGDFDEKQILAQFKENQMFKKTAVFLFSGVDFDSTELAKWQKHGLYLYLKKPVKRSIMLKTLADLRMQINFTNFQIASEPITKYEKPLLVTIN